MRKSSTKTSTKIDRRSDVSEHEGERKYGDATRRKLAYQAAAKLAKDVKLYDFPQAA